MKRFFKFCVYGFVGIIGLGIIIALFSEEEAPVSTGSKTKSSEVAAVADPGTKLVDASAQTQTLNGLVINLGEVRITKDSVQVGINIENTSDEVVTFYPDQGNAVIGAMQVDANMFFTDGDVSGDIMAGVQKEGVIEFLAPDGKEIDVEAVKELKLHFGTVFDESFLESKEANFVVPVK